MGHAWWAEGKPWEIALGKAALGWSETEATTGWTGEIVGNSLERVPRERRRELRWRSEMEAPDGRGLGGWLGFFGTILINAIVLKNVGPRRGNSWGRVA